MALNLKRMAKCHLSLSPNLLFCWNRRGFQQNFYVCQQVPYCTLSYKFYCFQFFLIRMWHQNPKMSDFVQHFFGGHFILWLTWFESVRTLFVLRNQMNIFNINRKKGISNFILRSHPLWSLWKQRTLEPLGTQSRTATAKGGNGLTSFLVKRLERTQNGVLSRFTTELLKSCW